jgi:hypothetical protein
MNDVRHHDNGTVDGLLGDGKFVRLRTADYALVSQFYWYTWRTPVGREYAVASVRVHLDRMRIAMLDLLADPGRFADCIPTAPGGPDEGMHHGFSDDEPKDSAHAWLDRVLGLYYRRGGDTNGSPAEHNVVGGVALGQVRTLAA